MYLGDSRQTFRKATVFMHDYRLSPRSFVYWVCGGSTAFAVSSLLFRWWYYTFLCVFSLVAFFRALSVSEANCSLCVVVFHLRMHMREGTVILIV